MAAQQRIIQPDFADSLKDWAEIIKNPTLIETAHKAARAQSALTETELKKQLEAREFIKNHESLKADLKKKQGELLDAQEAHNNSMNTAKEIHQAKVDAFDSFCETEKARLTALAESLSKKESGLEDAKKKQEAQNDKLAAKENEILSRHSTYEKCLNEKECSLKEREAKFLKERKIHLANESKLKEKEARLKDIFG